MASLIPGYEYDIFISYRQKDNKHDGWVSEFVNNLKGELESTFKEEISVYFDINPHDGLLETDSVDKSLENKLKCLIFIPVISRTYCDPKSFAWQHEFCAFNKLSKEDRFGRDIKLSSGNVASRILPVKIHDLDPEDKRLLETELGGIMRGIEFIYKEPGVNRPLTPKDSEDKNINKTNYRNQINKVANAVKEIITALKKQGQHPEEATKEDLKVKTGSKKGLKTKIIIGSIIALVLIILGIILIQKLVKPEEQHEKSIAVLPFKNDSPDQGRMYFINGTMEAILDNLCKIKDLRVPGRTSVEQYRDNLKAIPIIAKELDVNYILEGSGHRDGNHVRLHVQLLDARKDRHLWSKTYDADIEEIFSMQSEIAKLVAAEIEAIITPEERQLIEKVPTISFTANDFYLKGNEERDKYSSNDPSTRIALDRAHEMYEKALEDDPTFAQAYLGLAQVYWSKHYWESYLSESFLDSVLILVKKALDLDPQLSEAYIVKGDYYYTKGLIERSIEEYDNALKYNPNNSWAYYRKATASFSALDYVQRIDNMHKAVARNRGASLPNYFRTLARSYIDVGFLEQAKYYIQEAFTSDRDTATYLFQLAGLELFSENFEQFYKIVKEAWEMDSTIFNPRILPMELYYYMPSNYNEEAYLNALNWIEYYKKTGVLPLGYSYRIGMALWRVGKYEEAKYYFNQEIKYEEEDIRLGRDRAVRGNAFYNLAASYAILGEKEKAYKNLDQLNKLKFNPIWMQIFIKHDPFFDNMRKEERFQNIVKDMAIKFQSEHERVRKWLEEQGML